MKHLYKWLAIFALSLILVSSLALSADSSSEDYKVLKRAVQKGERAEWKKGEAAEWLNITVTDDATKKVEVKVTINLIFIDLFSSCVDGEGLDLGGKEGKIKLEKIKKMLGILKNSGKESLIVVHEDNKTIKIWID